MHLPSDPVVVSKACFEAAMIHAATELQEKGIQWRSFPELMTQHESFYARMEAIRSGSKEKINFLSILKKEVRAWDMGFIFKGSELDEIYFEKELEGGLVLGLVVVKIHHMGMGKAFTLGVRVTDQSIDASHKVWKDDFFRMFELTESGAPCYTYTFSSDLARALMGMQALCKATVPVLEKHVKRSFEGTLEERVGRLKVRERVSARSGYKEALEQALAWDAYCSLNAIFANPYSDLMGYLGPSVSPDGYIRASAYWFYRFTSPRKEGLSYYVSVPIIGDVGGKLHAYEKTQATQEMFGQHDVPIDQSFIDSTDAMEKAEEAGGKTACGHGELFEVLMRLDRRKGRLCWIVEYLIKSGHDRHDFIAVIDGFSGKHLGDDPWNPCD